MATSSSGNKATLKDAADAGGYFRAMADFVGFRKEDIAAIRETRFIIEKHIPKIVAKFYDHLLRYPPTRKYFLKKDGSLDQDNLQLRMTHLTSFWRRTASGEFGDDYAQFVDYVGRAHTSQGADPQIYIPERYVIGQVGFMQHAISEALSSELHEIDPKMEVRGLKAWNLLMMVILEMLSRAYSDEHEIEVLSGDISVDPGAVHKMAVEAYERGLGLYRSIEYKDVIVAEVDEIPKGERKIVQIDNRSIGIFHHKKKWYAISNHCLHVGGPIATGRLEGDTLICPWHGYRYDITDGHLHLDPSASLEMYPVEIKGSEIHIQVPVITWDDAGDPGDQPVTEHANEFKISELASGRIELLRVNGEQVAVFAVGEKAYAIQSRCTHEGGPLFEGRLDGETIICPWHGSCFNVASGEVVRGPAEKSLKTYRVVIDDEVGRVEQEDE